MNHTNVVPALRRWEPSREQVFVIINAMSVKSHRNSHSSCFLGNCHWPAPTVFIIFKLLLLITFPSGSAGKESACNMGDLGLMPGLGRSPGEGNSYPLQYSGLENSMYYSPWGAKSQTRLSDLTSLHHNQRFCLLLHLKGKIKILSCIFLSKYSPKLFSIPQQNF